MLLSYLLDVCIRHIEIGSLGGSLSNYEGLRDIAFPGFFLSITKES